MERNKAELTREFKIGGGRLEEREGEGEGRNGILKLK